MAVPKIHHYVPQFILRNFGNGKKDQVWVFDKLTKRTFATNAKNIASESRFYEFEASGRRVTLEPYLSEVEGKVKPILSRILRDDSLVGLGEADRAHIAGFLAIQLTRTRNFREQWREFPKMLRDALEANGDQVAEGSQAAALIAEIPDNDVKAETAEYLLDAPRELAHHFLAKDWALAMTDRGRPFLTSDNPLALQNMFESPHLGTLGLAVPGIEIYFPLSPVRALAIWCRSIGQGVRAAAAKRRQERFDQRGRDDAEGVLALADALSTGRPVKYSPQNVLNFNSLQVANSERYLFSSVNDFGLAEEMLSSHPHLSTGPRVKTL